MAVHNMLNSKNPRTSIDRKKKEGKGRKKALLSRRMPTNKCRRKTEIEKPLFYNHPSDNRSW